MNRVSSPYRSSKLRTERRRRMCASWCGRERRSVSASVKATAMLYLRPDSYAEPVLEFWSFDAGYIESLCAGDRPTEEHFVGYFTALLQLKLRSRLHSPQAVEDVRQ